MSAHFNLDSEFFQLMARPTLVRSTDPETSREAAVKASTKADTLRSLVYRALLEGGPMTHDELIAALPDWSASGVRTRCSELVARGRVVHDGYRMSAAGNRARVWRVA